MLKIFAILKNATFLIITCVALICSTTVLAVKTVQLSTQVAAMTASATATALTNRRAIAEAIAQTKTKARLRRIIAAIPLAGLAAAGYFERQDYLDWQADNPDGTFEDYSCEVATLSAEVVDEVLQELPERVRPNRNLVISALPDCSNE